MGFRPVKTPGSRVYSTKAPSAASMRHSEPATRMYWRPISSAGKGSPGHATFGRRSSAFPASPPISRAESAVVTMSRRAPARKHTRRAPARKHTRRAPARSTPGAPQLTVRRRLGLRGTRQRLPAPEERDVGTAPAETMEGGDAARLVEPAQGWSAPASLRVISKYSERSQGWFKT